MYLIWGLLVVMTWGLNSPITKLGISDFPVFLFVALRFIGTGLLFLPFAKLQKKDIKDLLVIAISFNVLHIGFQYLSLYFLTASASASIQRIQVPMAVLFSVIFLKEKISPMQMLGMMISLVGVVIIYGIPEVKLTGFTFIIMSAFFFAITQVMMKKTGDFHMPTFVAYTALFSVPFLLVLSLFFDNKLIVDNVDWGRFSISLGFQIFVLGFSLAIWQKLISTHGVNKLVPLSLLGVVFAILGGMVLLGEQLTYRMTIGAAVIIAGVAMVTFFKPKEGFWKRLVGKLLK
ncbi:MAG: DMT family transporter [Lactobacillaceae bacterium]|jgi:O-acetylserine/cysteine efflux transporter|nr:DMT family transporter [Lactobacillaceae bacterium]